ncbi:unnamed protein product [Prorocentrum cordatum]|uniref:Uncharacterized protein n=1 Tax=Prorocentrum cordatum TaxID=2364126 RepID=A0ABN9PAM3_9DINO|nr:unnamed protein product [Polarella glacialis]
MEAKLQETFHKEPSRAVQQVQWSGWHKTFGSSRIHSSDNLQGQPCAPCAWRARQAASSIIEPSCQNYPRTTSATAPDIRGAATVVRARGAARAAADREEGTDDTTQAIRT